MVFIEYIEKATGDSFVELINENNVEKHLIENNLTLVRKADADTHHLCKYCHGITPGTEEDILCSECQELFGHKRYSEL